MITDPPIVDRNSGGRGRAVNPIGLPPAFYDPPTLTTIPSHAVTERTVIENSEMTIVGATGSVALPYGFQRLAGNLIYFYQSGNDFYYVLGFGRGEFDSLVKWTLNGVDLVATGHDANIQVTWHAGTPGQAVDAGLASLDATWNEALPNICYAVVHLSDIASNWPELPNLLFWMKCRKVLDPRTGVTAYSENTVLQFYDWLRDPEGKNLRAGRINTASINAAATIADETLGSGKRYVSHPLIADSSQTDDWVKTFRILMDGYWFYTQNQWYLVLDRPAASVATYDDSAFLLDPAPEMFREEPADRINDVVIEWTDTSNDWTVTSARFSTAAVTAGTEDARTATYRLPWLHDFSNVQTKGTYLLNSYVYDGQLKLTHRSSTADRMTGDLITQSIAARGIAAQVWRILSRNRTPQATYEDILLEYNAAKYADTVGSASSKTASIYPDITSTPPDVTGFTSSSITEELYRDQSGRLIPRARLTWTFPSNYPWLDVVELSMSINGGEYRSIDEYAGLSGSTGIALVNDVMELLSYSFKLVVRSKIGQRRSAGVIASKTFAGKTTPPANVPALYAGANGDRVALKWQPSPDSDVLLYELRRGLASDTWSTAHYVGQTQALLYIDSPPYGSYRYFIKAIDAAAHYSASAVTRDITINPGAIPAVEIPGAFNLNAAGYSPSAPQIIHSTTYGGVVYGSGNLIAEVNVLADYVAGTFVPARGTKVFLCRTLSPATSESERAAGSYTSVGAWATAVDDPRRGGAPLWAPLPANASGDIYGMTDAPGLTPVMARLSELRIRFLSVEHQGVDTPANVSVATPTITNYAGTVVTNYNDVLSIGPDGSNSGFLGIHISTNSPYYQQVVKSAIANGGAVGTIDGFIWGVPLRDGVRHGHHRWLRPLLSNLHICRLSYDRSKPDRCPRGSTGEFRQQHSG